MFLSYSTETFRKDDKHLLYNRFSGLEIDWDILNAIINVRNWNTWRESVGKMMN